MKKELEKYIETFESVIALCESIHEFFRTFKHFSDAMFHAQIQYIEKEIKNLKKYRYDSRIICDDKLLTALPIQLKKEEIEAVLDEEDDALIYN